MKLFRVRFAALAASVACAGGFLASVSATASPAAASPAAGHGASASHPQQAQRQVTVMTQNLYLGADLTPLFAPGADFTTAAQKIIAHVAQVDFPARAAKIAGEVAAHHPYLVGLQEVALWQVGPNCGDLGTYVDYLTTLLQALAADGMHYKVASEDRNFSMAAPIPGIGCASFTDRDVILARADLPLSQLKLSDPQHAEYGSYQPIEAGVPNEMPITISIPGVPPQSLYIDRGWASVDVKVRGKSFRFVDTHLEAYGPANDPSLFRDIQANLLVQHVIDTSPLPVIAVGDYNSDAAPLPDLIGAYGILLDAGLTDAWPQVARQGDPGYTSGQTDNLNNIPSQIDHRIDLVLFSQGPINAVADSGYTVGNAPPAASLEEDHAVMAYDAATGEWLWPSDHAGVVVTLDVAKP